MEETMKKITEPAREIPVIFEKDVIVSGGGPGGVVAAIAAARMGADTILIDPTIGSHRPHILCHVRNRR